MSYKATAWAYDLELKGSIKPVLTALADFADEAGSCYPGQDKLALMTGLSVRTIRRSIERLEQMGILRREARHDERGYRTSDRYFLAVGMQVLPDSTAGRTDVESDRLPDTVTAGHIDRQADRLPDTLSTPTGHSDRAIRTFGSYEPSDEPSDTPQPPTAAVTLELLIADPDPTSTTGPTFEDFWAVWPRHEARKTATAAWAKATCRAPAARILAAATAYADSPWRPERQHVPHATTWLNGDRWDDPAPAQPEARRDRRDKDQLAYDVLAMGAEIEAERNRKAVNG